MWNPPLVDEKLGKRASALSEAAKLLAELVSRDVRTICFLKSRRGVELIQRFARLRLEDMGRADAAERIAPYRAGYTPTQRREIERRLATGELLAVVATDALELGIDVGDLDAAVCVTFPGTVASLRQMWGRAGPARGRAGHVRGGRGRARPVLLPPPRRVPRAAGRAGDPRPRVRGDPPRPPARGRLRAAADARGRGRVRRALGAERAAAGEAGAAARARRALPAARLGLPGGRDRAALRLARLGGDRRGGRRRADRQRRGVALAFGRPPRRHLPAHGTALRGRGPRPGRSPCAGPALRGRLVHAAEEGVGDLDRAGA